MKKSVLIVMTIFLSNCVFAIDGYKDFKFGMCWSEIKATGVCEEWDTYGKLYGSKCYKVAGKKRYIEFYYNHGYCIRHVSGDLSIIKVYFGKYRSSFYKKLVSGIGKKYKETYRLTLEQALGNKGNHITYFENARITLVQEDNSALGNIINLYYTKEEHPTFKKFASDVSSDDF